MNLKVMSREVWKLARVNKSWPPETPAPNTRYPVAEWSPRIGSLSPAGKITGGGCGPASPTMAARTSRRCAGTGRCGNGHARVMYWLFATYPGASVPAWQLR
jgi:hypothetical protein